MDKFPSSCKHGSILYPRRIVSVKPQSLSGIWPEFVATKRKAEKMSKEDLWAVALVCLNILAISSLGLATVAYCANVKHKTAIKAFEAGYVQRTEFRGRIIWVKDDK